MLFWNSEGGNADIVTALQNLADNLGNLDFARFSKSKLKVASVPQNTVTKIVDRERERVSRRTTLKISSDSEASKVLLIHGIISEPTLDDFFKSPWSLKPGEQGRDDLDGGYEIYAYAVGGTANIKIALEYQGDNQLINQSSNFMKINPLFGTGNNWDNSTGWADDYEAELNSAISGFKLFSFSSFNSGQEYNLRISPGGLSYQQGIAYPINVYLFNLDSISKALFWKCVRGQIDLQAIRETMIPIFKNGSWAARLPSTGGAFVLKPTHDRHIGLIDCKLSGETYAKTAIFNYQEGGDDSGKFLLVGHQ